MGGGWGYGSFYRWSCTPRVSPWRAAHDGGARGVLPAMWRSYPPRALHRILLDFLTQFSRAILEAFWYSKWVMQHIFGKLAASTFQQYKVCANQSLDERVMAPGSRGVGAVFSHFSGEDSGQMGDATGEPRVARCSWSCNLSNAPGLADQLVVSWKDSAREGGCLGGKTRQIFNAFFLIFCLCSRPRLT
jgi:hypothetical protein